MSTTRIWARRLLHGVMLLGELILLYAGLAVIFSDEADQTLNLTLWNIVAFLYLGIGAFVVRRRSRRAGSLETEPLVPQPGVRAVLAHVYVGLLPAMFSLLGLTAAVIVLLGIDGSMDPDLAVATKAMGSLVMVSAWLLLHVTYSRSYRLFYRNEGGGIEFPDTPNPTDVDFLYFAMTLGSSFATSDVNVTSTRMRWHVLVHSVLSFFYNAIVLAVGFRVMTGG